jgi:hypothetical protein
MTIDEKIFHLVFEIVGTGTDSTVPETKPIAFAKLQSRNV